MNYSLILFYSVGLLGNLLWLAVELRVEIKKVLEGRLFFFLFLLLSVCLRPTIFFFFHLVSEFFLEKYSIIICRFRRDYLTQKLFWDVYVLCCRLSHAVIGRLAVHGDDSWIEI